MTIDEFRDYVYKKNEGEDYGICPPPISDRDAIHILTKHLLGEDYYVVDPLGVEQCNTVIVADIILKYPEKKGVIKCFSNFIRGLFKNSQSMDKK